MVIKKCRLTNLYGTAVSAREGKEKKKRNREEKKRLLAKICKVVSYKMVPVKVNENFKRL